MLKPFYVHEHTNQKFSKREQQPRGFTLYVCPDDHDPRNVIVQGAWCSNKDNFCRKLGRETAHMAERKTINKRRLPDLLAQMAQVCGFEYQPHDYYYIWRYVM